MPQRRANVLLWILALLPAALFLATSASVNWQNPADTLNTLGRLAGVAGLGFMLVSAILSSRVPGFDTLFGGLTKLWTTHHQIAAVSFLLLLSHPLLLSFSAMTVSLDTGMGILFPTANNIPTLLGWSALMVMMVFLAPSFAFFGEPDYQRWKHIHKLAGVSLALALAHTFLLMRPANYGWQSVLWSMYAGLAVAAVCYRWVFSHQLLFKRHGQLRYTVVGATYPLKGTVELELRPERYRLAYVPGQFVYFTPYDRRLKAGYGQEHPYTIASAPHEENLRLVIKDLGDSSRALQAISPGAPVRVEGPYGALFPGSGWEDKELWIAGGIGITPFLGRARHFLATEREVDAHCFLCVQDEARALYYDELQAIASELPGFRVTIHYFYREGPLTPGFVERHCPDYRLRDCYLCGPPPLLHCAQRFLRSEGVPARRIHTEEFQLL